MAVKKLKLHQFNNLNKTLKFSFYDISYSVSLAEKIAYNKYIDTTFNAKKLAQVLQTITKKIGAHILSISCQDYEPVGASVCVLITEQPVNADIVNASNNLGKIEELYGHLDKSHIAVHTYPEYSPKTNIASFRVDIDVSTCGEISPLKCLNYLLEEFDSRIVTDIIEIDYFVRGFTRSAANEKIFIDHEITNIPDFIDKKFVKRFSVHNTNLTERRIWNTVLVVKDLYIPGFLFDERSRSIHSQNSANTSEANATEVKKIANNIINEIKEITRLKDLTFNILDKPIE